MKAFMLAAGKGKRLLPFTEDNPKPLIKVGGISLIEHNLLSLRKSNIEEVVINLHHFGEKIINLLGDGSRYGMKISYSIEEELLGTGGGINKALHHFDEPFIVLSGDTWSQFNMEYLSLDPDVLAHMVLVPNPESNFEGDVALVDGRVKVNKTLDQYTFSGISILSPELFINKEVEKFELWKDLLMPATEADLVSGEIYQGNFKNLNTLEDVEKLDCILSEE